MGIQYTIPDDITGVEKKTQKKAFLNSLFCRQNNVDQSHCVALLGIL
jgi:hypothetical protein